MKLDRERIISLGTQLPPSLGVLGRLQNLLQDPAAGLGEIVELVNVDPALTFQVIKLANSALYGLRSRCDSLEEAVARVGCGDIHQIVGMAVARQAFQGDLALYGISGGRLWENAVAVGILTGEFATAAGADAKSAYATGLLRNLGKMVLSDFTRSVHFIDGPVEADGHGWERKVFGLSSAEVAALLLDHWRFAPEQVTAVQVHRDPEPAVDCAGNGARLHLAVATAVEWGCGLPGELTGWRNDAEFVARAGLDPHALPALLELARAQFVQCSRLEWEHPA